MIELRKIADDNFDECIKLEPKEEQKNYVASNIRSLAEAYVALMNKECIPMPYAIYDNDIMVGFICYHLMKQMRMMMKILIGCVD